MNLAQQNQNIFKTGDSRTTCFTAFFRFGSQMVLYLCHFVLHKIIRSVASLVRFRLFPFSNDLLRCVLDAKRDPHKRALVRHSANAISQSRSRLSLQTHSD